LKEVERVQKQLGDAVTVAMQEDGSLPSDIAAYETMTKQQSKLRILDMTHSEFPEK
jgi:hypothetical protein